MTSENFELPDQFLKWFKLRGWLPRPFQLELLRSATRGENVLLIAPTGGGKTLAGFLPSLVELADARSTRSEIRSARSGQGKRASVKPTTRRRGIHTLYVSPLKALTHDVARNLDAPVKEMQLPIRVETRTGDTPVHRRQRQKHSPPDILLTTPEQLALMLASPDALSMFADLACVIVDELHAIVPNKRGDLLSLNLARLSAIAPQHRRVGLSATVDKPEILARYLQSDFANEAPTAVHVVSVATGVRADVEILKTTDEIPWAGHMARYAVHDVLQTIRNASTTLVFVNTRMQAEFLFQELWHVNSDNLAIALHHGSLSPEQRRKVESAMAKGELRAVVCTSTLDLGIDWGAVDLVVNVGAPKGAARIAQRIGRSNHRLNEPSRALLVPANTFEVLECEAARDAILHGEMDGEPERTGGLDVLAQHVLGMSIAAPFYSETLLAEVKTAAPYRHLSKEDFERVVEFAAHGGYALRAYERFAKIRRSPEGLWRIASPQAAQRYRMNCGTIVEAPMLKVRLVRKFRGTRAIAGGRVLGQVEEWFVQQLTAGDTFLFAGQILRYESIIEGDVVVTPSNTGNPKIPSFEGGKFPLSTFLATRVREMIADSRKWSHLPPHVEEWLKLQQLRSVIPKAHEMLIETFQRSNRYFLVCYPFDGRLCHQSLGMLLTRRLARLGLQPLGFVASEYSLAIWGLRSFRTIDFDALFDEDMLGDDLDAWLLESALLKRSFRNCAVIAGLVERRNPRQEKSGRQVNFSSDLIYDVLRTHEPNHILLKAAYQDAATSALDLQRLGDLLRRVKGQLVVRHLDNVSPLAVPVLLDIGSVPVGSEISDDLLDELASAQAQEQSNLKRAREGGPSN